MNKGRRFNIEDGKNFKLNEIKQKTANGYLTSIVRKYSPGEIIASTKRNQHLCPKLIGRPTDGKLVIRVPVQERPIPTPVIDKANQLRIHIIDTDGKRYNRP